MRKRYKASGLGVGSVLRLACFAFWFVRASSLSSAAGKVAVEEASRFSENLNRILWPEIWKRGRLWLCPQLPFPYHQMARLKGVGTIQSSRPAPGRKLDWLAYASSSFSFCCDVCLLRPLASLKRALSSPNSAPYEGSALTPRHSWGFHLRHSMTWPCLRSLSCQRKVQIVSSRAGPVPAPI